MASDSSTPTFFLRKLCSQSKFSEIVREFLFKTSIMIMKRFVKIVKTFADDDASSDK